MPLPLRENLPLRKDLLLRNGRLLDVVSGVYTEGDLLAVDGRIAETGTGLTAPNDADVRDLRGAFVLPGLIDAHVHVTAITADLASVTAMSPFYVAAHAARIMGGMLDRGFTTVRDVAGADFGLAAAQAEGVIRGPRLFFGGRALSQTGGHGDDRGAGDDSWPDPHGASASCRIADGVDAVRLAARDELRKGSHHIKVMASGGVASPTDRVDSVQYSAEELRAIVDEASACNRYVAAHAYTARAVNRAVEAGVRSVEHGNLMDDESVSLILRHDAFLVPTLVTYWALKREGKEFGLPEASWHKVDDVLHAGLSALELAYRGGVPLVYGTDLLGGMHRHQNEEFRIRAEVVSALDVIRSATVTAARLLGAEGELGTLAPGARADLVVLDGDPLADVGLLADPAGHMPLVVQAGAAVRSLLLHRLGQHAAELDGDAVGAGVQFGGGIERELQPGQGMPLQVKILGEDRHLVVDRILDLRRVRHVRGGERLVDAAVVPVFRLDGEREELPGPSVEELQQQRGVQRRLVPVSHPPPLHRGQRALLHRRVIGVGERVLTDCGECQALPTDVGAGDRLRAGAADRRRVHEREVRLVEEVVDQDRRVGRHPHGRHDHRGHIVAVRQWWQLWPRRARCAGCEPDDPVLFGYRGGAPQRGPGRDRCSLLQRRDQRAGAIGGVTPAVVAALERAVHDLAGGQPGPAVRAGVGERGHDPADAGQRPVLAGQPHAGRLGGHLIGKRDRVPVVRQCGMDVGEIGSLAHASRVAKSRSRWTMGDNRAVAQIEVSEESIRGLVGAEMFARGAQLAALVSGLSASGPLITAAVDGVRVTARIPAGGLDGECECPDPAPCAHAVGAVLAWIRSAQAEDEAVAEDDEAASLLAEFEDVLAEHKPDAEYLDELVDDLEELLDEEPAAVRDLADRVMNLLEARDAADLTDLLERVEELWLEARQVAGPGPQAGLRRDQGAQALLERAHGGQHRARLVSAVRHAVVAARILAPAERVPVRRLQQLLLDAGKAVLAGCGLVGSRC